MRYRTLLRLAVAGLVLLGGCDSSTSRASEAVGQGSIDGNLVVVGGPAPGGPRPTSGQVSVLADDHEIAKIEVPVSGTFRLDLDPGDYEVVGNIGIECIRDTVSITSDQSTNLAITCSVR